VVKMAKDYYAPMHTAEHILNQTMVRMFNCGRSFSMHLEKKKSKCDYHFDRNLTDEEVAVIETKLNELINADLQVTEEFISKEEAGKLFDLKRLPEGTGDTIRIMKVGDYDACPCIGAHVKSTKEIGGFKIISSSFEEGVLRVRYRLIEPE
jgi:misacylated tRNA(Ala) deacylase